MNDNPDAQDSFNVHFTFRGSVEHQRKLEDLQRVEPGKARSVARVLRDLIDWGHEMAMKSKVR